MSRRFRTPAALILVLACAGTLAGCGVKGPLEPPPKAASGGPQASAPAGGVAPVAAANGAPADASEPASVSTWNVNQSAMVAQTGTAAAPLSAAPTPMSGAPATLTGSSSGGSQQGKTHTGVRSTAPTSLDQVTHPNTPFILDGLL